MHKFSRNAMLAAAIACASAALGDNNIESTRNVFEPKVFPKTPVHVTVNVTPGNNMPIVAGELDGRKCFFLLDTGATHTTLDLNFLQASTNHVELTPVSMAAMSNVTTMPWICHIDSMKVGDAIFSDFSAMVLDLSHLTPSIGTELAGILGMNVIGCTRTLISLGHGEMIFGLDKEARADFATPAMRDRNDPDSLALFALIGDKRIPIIIDTGSTFTILPESSGWQATTNHIDIGARNINSGGMLSSSIGVEGEMELHPHAKIKVRPLLTSGQLSQIGADALLNVDMLIESRAVAFRPCAKKR